MKHIAIFGAGRSTYDLYHYLTTCTESVEWNITAVDRESPVWLAELLREKDVYLKLDISDHSGVTALIRHADLVISMLPPSLHLAIAKTCLTEGKDCFTASYVSEEMKALDLEVRSKGLLFLNEIGLDPGIDHMSAMKELDRLRSEQKEVVAFRSFTGGLVAPESDDNPWHYKITWNPWNVVVAGQGGDALFIEDKEEQALPYHQLFLETWDIDMGPHGTFTGYANRDTLKYVDLYGLQKCEDVIRGTLRSAPFTKAWSVLVTMGITNAARKYPGNKSRREFFQQVVIGGMSELIECMFAIHPHDLEAVKAAIDYLELFSEVEVEQDEATPAEVLLDIILEKWSLAKGDKDMIVMTHEIVVQTDQGYEKTCYDLKVIGTNEWSTAMSKTVGLPLGIAAQLRLSGKLKDLSGVQIPTIPALYDPVLAALKIAGIEFTSRVVD